MPGPAAPAAGSADAHRSARPAAAGALLLALAAVATAAVRVAVEYWCARQDELAFTDAFHEACAALAQAFSSTVIGSPTIPRRCSVRCAMPGSPKQVPT